MKKTILLVFILSLFSLPVWGRGTSSAIIGNAYFGLGYINPSDINDNIIGGGDEFPGIQDFLEDAGTVKWAKNFGVMLGYQFKYRFTAGLLFDYSRFGSNILYDDSTAAVAAYTGASATTVNAYYYNYLANSSAFGIGPAFYYNFYSRGKLSFSAGLSFVYLLKSSYSQSISYSTSTTVTEDNITTSLIEGSGKGYALNVSFPITYYFTNYLGASLELGYKIMKAGSFTDVDGNDVNFTYLNGTTDDPAMPISMKYSGLYFLLSLKFDMNIGSSYDSSESTNRVSEDKSSFDNELNTNWEPEVAVPSIDELRDLKIQARGKYQKVQNSDATKANRYKRLYDIIDRVEKGEWDRLSPEGKREKIDKIKRILEN